LKEIMLTRIRNIITVMGIVVTGVSCLSAAVETISLRKIVFLIHPDSYAQLPKAEQDKWSQYLEYEKRIEARWKEHIASLKENEFLVFCLPLVADGSSPAGRLARYAETRLGPGYLALTGDSGEWPRILKSTLEERGYVVDPNTLLSEGWGESFDGCVAGYSIYLSTALRFANPAEVVFDLTVPDMPLLLKARLVERIRFPEKKLRLFLFEDEAKRPIGLFMPEVAGLTKPYLITVSAGPDTLAVYNKQGEPVEISALPDALARLAEGGIEIALRCDRPSGFFGGKREGPLFFVGKNLTVEQMRTLLVNAGIREGL